MNDTPENIQKLQLEIWLAKSPGERLKQTLMDNDSLFKLWDGLRKGYNDKSNNNDSEHS